MAYTLDYYTGMDSRALECTTVESYSNSQANAMQFLCNYTLSGHIPVQFLTTKIQLQKSTPSDPDATHTLQGRD